ncbi:helix-turn-helix transcriptional regulator [Telluribacter sp.]|jgi:transcriptional regulator with XRE-family HTH domain|uniref:helix-turn-helix transcriptional regulator n=1 Tax=Telluribacter sp. TaxID=1978767 RepID=UPI002E11DDB9|nr:helix-turn-helix transcriptional regulator [Telluribacter sp.]
MDLNDKIKQILVDKNVSPSHFADEIGVQRSSISHILAGRNRPSLDIIQKIVKRYPDLGMDWILEEEENLPPKREISRYESDNYTLKNRQNRSSHSALELNRDHGAGGRDVQTNLAKEESREEAPKNIERILIFYSDGTFREYTPGR